MSYIKPRPHGFRAVRRLGKTEVVYCVEWLSTMHGNEQVVDVYTADGSKERWPQRKFKAAFVREYSPMPDAVRAMFEGKPSFEEWWADSQAQK